MKRVKSLLCAMVAWTALPCTQVVYAQSIRFGSICNTGEIGKIPLTDPRCPSAADPNPCMDWKPTACDTFHTNLASKGSSVIKWNSVYGEVHALEDRWPTWENQVEGLDLLHVLGHGNGSGFDGWRFSSFYPGDFAVSKSMLLGTDLTPNDGVDSGLDVLSIHSCYALTASPTVQHPTDPKHHIMPPESGFPSNRLFEFGVSESVWPRWSKAMTGGLKMIAGSWAEMPVSGAEKVAGNYATYLAGGSAFSEAWRRASFDQHSLASPAVLVTGRDDPDCTNRLRNMKLSNLKTFDHLRGANVGFHCYQPWW